MNLAAGHLLKIFIVNQRKPKRHVSEHSLVFPFRIRINSTIRLYPLYSPKIARLLSTTSTSFSVYRLISCETSTTYNLQKNNKSGGLPEIP